MSFRPVAWRTSRGLLSTADHTLIMGILNVTPDSFSDGGLFVDEEAALSHGLKLVGDGADMIDVGGESTRPGAASITAQVEIARVVPIIEKLAAEGAIVSVDTSKAEVARAALDVGAAIVNDVTALGDDRMAGVVADAGAGLVLMHMRGTPRTMQQNPTYGDVVGEVAEFLRDRAARAQQAGIGADQICIDPGIGFGKNLVHNLTVLNNLDRLVALGYPVMVGASRKSFIGAITGADDPLDREAGTLATTVLAVASGVACIRVHEVAGNRQVIAVADATVRVAGFEEEV